MNVANPPEFAEPIEDIVAAVRDLDLRNARLEQENADLRNALSALVKVLYPFPVAEHYSEMTRELVRARDLLKGEA